MIAVFAIETKHKLAIQQKGVNDEPTHGSPMWDRDLLVRVLAVIQNSISTVFANEIPGSLDWCSSSLGWRLREELRLCRLFSVTVTGGPPRVTDFERERDETGDACLDKDRE